MVWSLVEMIRVMKHVDQLWSRKEPLVLNSSIICQAIKAYHLSKAAADPPRLAETKHHSQSSSRRAPSKTLPFCPTCPVALRLTTITAAIASQATNHVVTCRVYHHQLPLTRPGEVGIPARDVRRRRLPFPRRRVKMTSALALERSWGPFRKSGCAASPTFSNASNSRAGLPEPVPVVPRGPPYDVTVSIASGAGGGRERDDGRGEAGAAATVAVVPPAPAPPPVQF
jgi:hypothetical protein